MPKSMTGFGRSCRIVNDWEIVIEIRSVNHRYFESSIRIPHTYSYLEPYLKKRLKEIVHRGKVELSLSLTPNDSASTKTIQFNETVLAEYLSALRGIAERYSLIDDFSLSNILQLPNLFSVSNDTPEEEAILQMILPVLSDALDAFVRSRSEEGKRLQEDISQKLNECSELVEELSEQTPRTVAAYRERLLTQLKELLQQESIEESRILTEAAIFADKIAIDEELVRLKSHMVQFHELLDQEEPIGRKCDFLLQEMNREVNTIGSKGNDLAVSKIVVELKSILEKIREQIQNIE